MNYPSPKVKGAIPQKLQDTNCTNCDTSFQVIEYPYDTPIKQQTCQQFIQLHPTKVLGNESLDKTMSDVFERFTANKEEKSNSVYHNKVNISLNSGNSYYCIYCEEIYKNCINNNYPLTEKQCIYCGKMISLENLEKYKTGYNNKKKPKTDRSSPGVPLQKSKTASKLPKYKQTNSNKNIKNELNWLYVANTRKVNRQNTFHNVTVKKNSNDSRPLMSTISNKKRLSNASIINKSSKFNKVLGDDASNSSMNPTKVIIK